LPKRARYVKHYFPTKEIFMKLRKWLDQKKMTNRAFARLINTSESAVHMWARTDGLGRMPRQKHMMAMQKATSGKVRPQDFYS
jgi:DNA-binding transcriptional regulator YiaG